MPLDMDLDQMMRRATMKTQTRLMKEKLIMEEKRYPTRTTKPTMTMEVQLVVEVELLVIDQTSMNQPINIEEKPRRSADTGMT